MIRPYSFRFPSDIRTVLEPWRKRLSDSSGTGSFDAVVAMLTDRDRSIENYLSLGVAQGFLGIENAESFDFSTTEVDIPGAAVTVTVPAGRKLRVSWHSHIFNNDFSNPGGDNSVSILLYDGSTFVAARSRSGIADSADSFGASEVDIDGFEFVSPAAGTHTYKLRAQITHGPSANMSGFGTGTFLAVEDIGPAERFQ